MKVEIDGQIKDLRALWFEDGIIKFLDQRKIPEKVEIFNAKDYNDVAFAIKDMVVRGAPAIGVSAAYGIAQAVLQGKDIKKVSEVLKLTRPTAHDLFFAVDYMLKKIDEGEDPIKASENYAEDIVERARKIGEYGNSLIKDNSRIMTHCNAGALAVLDWGTALAPMRYAKREGKNIFVWVDETRPRLQGARLTSWELKQEGIDHRIIADNASGFIMQQGKVDLIIVGADRIALNGDFANKIGTYEKAVLAKENGIPFYVAAPMSTIDKSIESGKKIPIEERSQDEVLYAGSCRIAPEGVKAYNPAFDVTPSKYVEGFITEYGIIKPNKIKDLLW
ncbi:MAG: S-methyl-5-thioribose-1-phosphate isomerase [Thermoplasmata archaeon]|nr:S-methyl-5-thioribose-1-phosphate isomerase [Thermoplasmata archaeon]